MPRDRENLGQFLFGLPMRTLTREQRIEAIRAAVRDGEQVAEEDLDHVLAKLLEEIQRED